MKIRYGRWNRAKAKVLLCLESAGSSHPMAAAQIYATVGVPYSSLVSGLSRWHKWGYVGRYRKRWGTYCYYILPKGRGFLHHARGYLDLGAIIAEIRDF